MGDNRIGKELTARELLERFGYIAEPELATLLGVSVRTLQNRRPENLPAFVKAGRRRLFVETSVREYLERRRSLPA